jgi:hypothetical protein
VETISNGSINKVVLSRKEVIELPEFELVSVLPTSAAHTHGFERHVEKPSKK